MANKYTLRIERLCEQFLPGELSVEQTKGKHIEVREKATGKRIVTLAGSGNDDQQLQWLRQAINRVLRARTV